MPNGSTPVNVNVNFNGVSYNATTQQWSGTPTWNVNPNPTNVPPSHAGNTMTLRFNLNAAAVPNGFTATFANNGILFGVGWTGGPPSQSNATTITVDDTFDNLSQNVDFEYSIAVVLNGLVNGSNVSQAFTLDPDVENQAGSVMKVTHTAS